MANLSKEFSPDVPPNITVDLRNTSSMRVSPGSVLTFDTFVLSEARGRERVSLGLARSFLSPNRIIEIPRGVTRCPRLIEEALARINEWSCVEPLVVSKID